MWLCSCVEVEFHFLLSLLSWYRNIFSCLVRANRSARSPSAWFGPMPHRSRCNRGRKNVLNGVNLGLGRCAASVSFDVSFIQLAWSVSVGGSPDFMGHFDRKLSRSLMSSGLVNRPVVVLVSFALYPLDFNSHQPVCTKLTRTPPPWVVSKLFYPLGPCLRQVPAAGGAPWGPRCRGGVPVGAFVANPNETKWLFSRTQLEAQFRPWVYRPVFDKDSGRPIGLAATVRLHIDFQQ